MDAARSVSQAEQTATHQRIQIALLKKQLDAAKSQGDAVVRLLDTAVARSKGIDVGQQFDRTA